MQQNEWIIEDTGRPCFEVAFRQADVIILLEIPSQIRNYRLVKRWIKQRFGTEKCNYNSDINMLKCMFTWSKDNDSGKDNLKERVGHYQDKMIILKAKSDIKKFKSIHVTNLIMALDVYDIPAKVR
jgi:adenylate kinase family enzyme